MNGSARLRRLENDYEMLVALHQHNGLIYVIAVDGTPPERYLIGYRCRGVADVDSQGRPRIIEDHRLEIALTLDYPRMRPLAFWKTSIFHPNFRNGEICWEWYPQQTLRETCEVFGEMVQYKNYNSTSPLNMDASMWAMQHRSELPIDSRSLLETPAGQPAVRKISSSFYISSAVVTGSIPLQIPTPTLESEVMKVPFCGECGFKFADEHSEFCPNCGEPRRKVSISD